MEECSRGYLYMSSGALYNTLPTKNRIVSLWDSCILFGQTYHFFPKWVSDGARTLLSTRIHVCSFRAAGILNPTHSFLFRIVVTVLSHCLHHWTQLARIELQVLHCSLDGCNVFISETARLLFQDLFFSYFVGFVVVFYFFFLRWGLPIVPADLEIPI